MHKTKIDWATHTWNPVWGCRNHCPYCYARATAHRWGQSFEPHWRYNNFIRPMPKEPGARIFVNSMSEIAHWESSWWISVLDRIRHYPEHRFLFLTKDVSTYYCRTFPSNCWLGVTVTDENELTTYQDDLGIIAGATGNLTFISIEPILRSINPALIDSEAARWIILGAETGNRKDRVIPPPEWIEPFLDLQLPLYMKSNLPWSGPWRKEYPL